MDCNTCRNKFVCKYKDKFKEHDEHLKNEFKDNVLYMECNFYENEICETVDRLIRTEYLVVYNEIDDNDKKMLCLNNEGEFFDKCKMLQLGNKKNIRMYKHKLYSSDKLVVENIPDYLKY